MSGTVHRAALAFIAVLSIGRAATAETNVRVFQINDHLISFYAGRPPQPSHPPSTPDWAADDALNVGVSTYVIHRGDQALVYDTFPLAEPARWVRNYLTKAGIKH